jgi:hypothetical protein
LHLQTFYWFLVSKAKELTKCHHACADLDHLNEDLRAGLVDWLTWLKNDIGYVGWRFDFVKVSRQMAGTLGSGDNKRA